MKRIWRSGKHFELDNMNIGSYLNFLLIWIIDDVDFLPGVDYKGTFDEIYRRTGNVFEVVRFEG